MSDYTRRAAQYVVISGAQKQKTLLTAALDPERLVRMCSDLLFCRKHEKIRRTDGPGDGGRDIHSLSVQSDRHLTQCKFHANPNTTCTSRELAELPMAMVKLGYKKGLFATNAGISPQAKREFLDGYEDLTLEFLDGDDLAAEVISDTLMRALWFDGEHFTQVNFSSVFPLLVRLHNEDMPFSLFPAWGDDECFVYSQSLQAKYPYCRFTLRPARLMPIPFEPYRAPEPLTQNEGGMPFLQTMEMAVEGNSQLSDLFDLSKEIGEGLLGNLDEDLKGVTVRVGRPYLCPLRGTFFGMHIPTDVPCNSYIRAGGACDSEFAWFAAGPSTAWSAECDARVTEADWVRLYADDLDCCLAYEIEGRSSASAKVINDAVREIQRDGWTRSLFCLMPAWDEWSERLVPEPDEKVLWPWDGRLICGWFHASLLGGLVPFRIAPHDESVFLQPDEQAFEAIKEAVRRYLNGLNDVEFLEPDRARHMVALAGADPFPEMNFVRTRTAEMIAYLEGVPSPIRPGSRRFMASVAWKTDLAPETVIKAARLTADSATAMLCTPQSCGTHEDYLHLHLDLVPDGLMDEPTHVLLGKIHTFLHSYLTSLEASVWKELPPGRCTRQFWRDCFNVNLGLPMERSDKVILWRGGGKGDWTPVVTGKTSEAYLRHRT